jgi:hypothetical protein
MQATIKQGEVKVTTNRLVGKCPVCGGSLDITRLECRACSTALEGRFRTCDFCHLSQDQHDFVRVFIKCRGNIREVEKELGISYPTVRNRLDAVIRALGYSVEDRREAQRARDDILSRVEAGELEVDRALRMLREEK